MNESRHRRGGVIFLAVCDLEPAERAAELDRECGEDDVLRREVEAMLASEEAHAGFLTSPPRIETEQGLDSGSEVLGRLAGRTKVGDRYELRDEVARGGQGAILLGAPAGDQVMKPVHGCNRRCQRARGLPAAPLDGSRGTA